MRRAVLVHCVVWSLVLGIPAGSHADPVTAPQVLVTSALRLGKKPRGVLPLLELWRNWDSAPPKASFDALESISRSRALSPSRLAYARILLAKARLRRGETDAAQADFATLGFSTAWRIIGPFDNEGKRGFERLSPAEQREPLANDTAVQGKGHSVTFRDGSKVAAFGYVAFDSAFRPVENSCAVAETWVTSGSKREPLTVWVGAGGAVTVRWNGEPVIEDSAYRFPDPDRFAADVVGEAGWNRVTVKVCTRSAARWGFYLRIGARDGGIKTGLRFSVKPEVSPSPSAESKKASEHLGAFRELEKAALAESSSPADLEDFARYLAYTGGDDPATQVAKQLASSAVDREPTVRRFELLASLSPDRSELSRLSERALAFAPGDPSALMLRAQVQSEGPAPEDSLPLLRKAALSKEHAFEASVIASKILRRLGLSETAATRLSASVGPARTPRLVRALAEAADAAGRRDEAVALRRELVSLRFDDVIARKALIADAVARDDADFALSHLEALRRLSPNELETLRYTAQVYRSLGRDDGAIAAYKGAIELAPDDAGAWAAYGRTLLDNERREEALSALKKSIALRPQDAATRELLEQLSPKQRVDEAYATPSREILKRRVSESRYPFTYLERLSVHTVFESGLGSNFEQLAVQVHDDEGARRFQAYSIQFDPDTQRVDLRLAQIVRKDGTTFNSVQTYERQNGEPWYRIYYDTRSLVVVFPDLQKGDVVELRYRIDDVGHRNLFADYFGDFEVLQDTSPIAHLKYILVSPRSRKFYFNQPELPGLKRRTEIRGESRVDSFEVQAIPALFEEQGMPGLTEVVPYIHVSTYRNWEDVGRWYWGLIQDQLYADRNLRKIVQDLVANAKSDDEKVRNIYGWVIKNTRYVGLEFGIHGYLPYRVPQIVQRGFGDCKDKASLLYTMFREAGIDARIVLVRTRRNGAIRDLPASLAVFDHAITYVPSLDLYLDGTAEHSGSHDLPEQDQGVTVLVVGPKEAVLRRTPTLPASSNRRDRELVIQIRSDGSAVIRGKEQIAGTEAPRYRERYQAIGTRLSRFERALDETFSGAKLSSVDFDSLSDVEKPVVYRYEVAVPQLVRRHGSELQLPPSVVGDEVRVFVRSASRRLPLDLGTRRHYTERTVYQLPKGSRLTGAPRSGDARSKFGRVTLDVSESAGQLEAKTEITIDVVRVSPSDYPKFREWILEADRLLRQRFSVAQEGR